MTRKKALSTKASVVAIISDIHFDLHDVPTWRAWCAWAKANKPDKIVINGDLVDLGMLSSYKAGLSDPINAIDQIKCAVREVNALLAYTKEIIILEGNHEDRWAREIMPTLPQAIAGSEGLTLKDQFYAQGLNPKITWLREDVLVRGVSCGPFMIRHGHNQCRGFGAGKHLAATKLDKNMGQNEVFGHHHKGQVFCKTALGRTAVAVATPCMTVNHNYDKDADWQRGFVSLELYGPNHKYATPYMHLIQDGHFSFAGKVYDGN